MSDNPITPNNTTPPPAYTPPILYCANHPNVETGLRCNNCSKPICPKCARLTPTGYRCRECLTIQQKVFDTARIYDYPLAFGVAAALAFPASLIISSIGFFTIFVTPIIGFIISEAVRFVTRKRRSKRLSQIAAVGAFLGSIPLAMIGLLGSILSGNTVNLLLPLLWQFLYAIIITSTVYYRTRGIQM